MMPETVIIDETCAICDANLTMHWGKIRAEAVFKSPAELWTEWVCYPCADGNPYAEYLDEMRIPNEY